MLIDTEHLEGDIFIVTNYTLMCIDWEESNAHINSSAQKKKNALSQQSIFAVWFSLFLAPSPI